MTYAPRRWPLGDGEVDGTTISCPRHGAQFDLRSGKTLSLPAVVDIAAYPIRIVDGVIQVGILKIKAKPDLMHKM